MAPRTAAHPLAGPWQHAVKNPRVEVRWRDRPRSDIAVVESPAPRATSARVALFQFSSITSMAAYRAAFNASSTVVHAGFTYGLPLSKNFDAVVRELEHAVKRSIEDQEYEGARFDDISMGQADVDGMVDIVHVPLRDIEVTHG